jgi:hypothetical protein
MELVSYTEAEGSQDVGPSGIKKNYIHSKERTFINNVMPRCVKECEEDEPLHPVIAPS